MIRKILATIVGIFVAGVVVGVVQMINMALYPAPPGIDLHDPVQVAVMVSKLPAPAFLVVLAAWSLGCFVGGWVATRIAQGRTRIPAVIVGLFILAGVLYNIVVLPHPLWMSIAGVLLPLPCALLGARIASKKAA